MKASNYTFGPTIKKAIFIFCVLNMTNCNKKGMRGYQITTHFEITDMSNSDEGT